MKKPAEFSYDKWISQVAPILEHRVEVPSHWMSRKKLTENLGKGVSTADLIAKKLVEQGLLVRHKVGVAIYYEPIIKEENK
jgi:predicted transcriptional regulator